MGLNVFTYALLAAAQLKTGRYVGYIAVDGLEQKLGAVYDSYVVQPSDVTAFPRQNGILKITLGGLAGHEYETYVYEDARYDYENGLLSLESVGEDFIVNAAVTNEPHDAIDGQVFVRSAGTGGSIHLERVSDEPGAGSGAVLPAEQYLPALAGQYRGICGENRAVLLQIETARGLELLTERERHGLHNYAIQGRVGIHDPLLCGADNLWCVTRNYVDGTYDFAAKRLIIRAPNGTDDCDVTARGLSCGVHLESTAAERCELTRDPKPSAIETFTARSFHLATTPAQRAKLPDPSPPNNDALVAALRGTFTGNLYNEATGRYQVMRLNVIASTSIENPHNENMVFVTATAMLHFGGGNQPSREFWSQQFERRSFYLTPGFTLESPRSDAFMQISDWRTGQVRGVWYSRQFGRVGTFELVKGTDVQTPPPDAKFAPNITGAFKGRDWFVDLLLPLQVPRADVSTAQFQGEYGHLDGIIPRRSVDSGAYDFYRGAVGFLGSDDRLVSGAAASDGSLAFFWPGAPIWGVLMSEDHDMHPFLKEASR